MIGPRYGRRMLQPESIAVASGRPERTHRAPLSTPIVLSAPFHHGPDDNYYLRQGSSDTIRSFEDAVGALEGGQALAFGSGMAAVAAVVEGQPTGTVAVSPRQGYTGTGTIFAMQQQLGRMTVREVDVTDTDAVLAALPGANLLWLESPTNPMLGVADLPVLIEAAHEAGAIVCVDSTFNTPLIVRPLDFGADVVMHSATKYLAGHSDVLMGVLVTRSPSRWARPCVPGATSPARSPVPSSHILALRGLRTLAVRMERAQANATESGHSPEHPSRRHAGALPGTARRSVARAGNPTASRVRRDGVLRGRRYRRRRREGVPVGRADRPRDQPRRRRDPDRAPGPLRRGRRSGARPRRCCACRSASSTSRTCGPT